MVLNFHLKAPDISSSSMTNTHHLTTPLEFDHEWFLKTTHISAASNRHFTYVFPKTTWMIVQVWLCLITDTYFLAIHRRNFLLLSYNQGVSVQCNICEPYLQNIYCSVDEDEAWPCGQIALDNSWQNKETTFGCFLIHRGSSQRVVRRISFCRVFFFSLSDTTPRGLCFLLESDKGSFTPSWNHVEFTFIYQQNLHQDSIYF